MVVLSLSENRTHYGARTFAGPAISIALLLGVLRRSPRVLCFFTGGSTAHAALSPRWGLHRHTRGMAVLGGSGESNVVSRMGEPNAVNRTRRVERSKADVAIRTR